MAEKTEKSSVENIELLWEQVMLVWDHGVFGVSIGQVLIALVIFVGFLLIRGIFSKYVLYRLHQWTQKSTTLLDDKIVDALIPPLRFIPLVFGFFFAAQYIDLDNIAGGFSSKFLRSMIAFVIFWSIHRAADPLSHSLKKLEKILSKTMLQWIFKFIKVVVIFIGAAVILEVWGIAVGPILAGLGLFGAAVALGAQDLFKNLIGGITVIAEKRFHPGEWIMVEGVVEGVVEEIGFRSTKVRRFDKAPVHVPNSQLSDASVINFSRMTHRRIYWKIGITYSTNVEQLRVIRDEIMAYIMGSPDFAKPPEVSTFVNIDSFNDSSIDFMIYCFTKTTDWGEWLAIKEDFALAIKEIVAKAGSDFAFPSQSLYIEGFSKDAAEIFVPPQ